MALIGKGLLKKLNKDETSVYLNNELENNYNILKENVIYGQQLAHIGSWTRDIRKDEIFLSDEIYNILGCTPQEFDGKLENYYLFIHPDDLKEVKEATQGALEGKEYDIEYRIVTPGGVEKYVHEKTKVLLDEENNPIKIIGIIQDITVKKLIENDLKALGENYMHAQKVAGVGSWKYDALEDRIFLSEETYRILGIDPLDFRKDYDSYMELVHPEDRDKMQTALEKCLEGKAYEISCRILKPDGTVRYVISKGEPLFGPEQRIVGIIGTVQDITESEFLKKELQKNYKNLVKAQELAHIGSWEVDLTLNKSYWSEEARRIYGITSEQYDQTYEGFIKFVHPEDIEIIEKSMQNLPGNQPFDLEFRIIRPDGSVRNVHQLLEFIFDEDGKPVYIYGTTQDITEKKELQKALEEKQDAINKIQRRYQMLIQESGDIFEIISADGTIQYVSPAVEKMLGLQPEEITGRSIFEFVEEEEKYRLTKMLGQAFSSPRQDIAGDVIIMSKSGKKVFVECTMNNQLSEPSIQGIVINYRDITKRVEMEREIAYIATHDELTGLPNRAYFYKQIKLLCDEAKQKESTFAVMKLNIDGFKFINDALGYQSGDLLIIEISKLLKSFIGDMGFVCRFLGDRFVICISGLYGIEEYESIAAGIINLFSNPIKIGIYELYVTASIGVSLYPQDSEDPDSLLKCAHNAMLRAESEGKNSYKFYSPNMDISNYKQFILANDLHKAIGKGQFRMYYQPIVNLVTGEILACEALIRWEHPTWDLVTPDEFVPLAEETGLIVNLGNWVLREVCRSYRQWLKEGLPPVKISINYSATQFFTENFVENIKNTIRKFELDPHFLIIEITEGVLLNNSEQVIDHIKNLRVSGIQVALDDFGTGVSSLAYLNVFKVDFLKLDRSFIKNIPSDETSNIITRAVVNLARDLRIKLVAEGIENKEQLAYLRQLNCFSGQGFLYSKPVPEQDIKGVLAVNRCKPIQTNESKVMPDRRKYFRIKFSQLLAADMTILQIKGQKVKMGNAKVVIKNIGPGGLCFVSNIRLPVNMDILLQLTTQLLGKKICVYGKLIWTQEIDKNIYEYGIEFTFDENERMDLSMILNLVQVKMKNNNGIVEGSFITGTAVQYFN